MGGLNFAGFPHIERLSDFMAASDDYESARAVLWGIGQDFTTSYRPGTRFGPGRIREASYGIEEFSYHSLKSLTKATFFDLGVFAAVVGSTLMILVSLAHQSIRGRRRRAPPGPGAANLEAR